MTAPAPIIADVLISGGAVVTMDAERRVLRDGAVAMRGDRIVAVGPRQVVEAQVTAREVVDARRFVVMPGLVNTHVHITGDPLVRGYIPEDLDFMENIFGWLTPLHWLQTEEDQRISAQLAAAEMLLSGTTCFLEAGTVLALEPVVEGLKQIGIRGIVGDWVMERAFNPEDDQTAMIDRALAQLEDEVARFPRTDDAMVWAWPNLVGHQTNTDPVWRFAKQLADAHGLGVSAHMSPSPGDAAWYLETLGRRPVEHLAQLGVLGPNLSLTHAVHVDEAEVALLAESGTNIAHCPIAALKGGYGVTTLGRFPEMARAGVNLTLGTDGGATSDLHRCIHLAAGLSKDARRDTGLFPPEKALEMATIDGARSLQIGDSIGSLEVGKKADLVLHDTDRPEWRPLHDIPSQLAWVADGRSVHSVWVNGRRVVEAYRLTTLDQDRLYAEAETAARALIARSGLPDRRSWPVT